MATVLLMLIGLFVARTSAKGATGTVATSGTTLTAPKWLDAPILDGQCGDTAYDQAGRVSLLTRTGGPSAEVKLLHSGLDFYVCFTDLPRVVGQRAVVRVDSDHSRSRVIASGDYEFSISAEGIISSTQGTSAGAWELFSVPAGDFAAVAAVSGRGAWNAELRISLEWLGGYARTDGLSLAVEQANGKLVQQWPLSASPTSPATWGDLVLAPLYPDTVTAASAFLDGHQGYLVVPYAADLNPAEITIEAWVRVVDGDCGTLVGNGRNASYWLAFCRMIQFGHDGRDSVETGQTPLGDGWHHVAVTMDAARGIRTFYLDGQVDARFGWEPAQEDTGRAKELERLGVSDRMLRIGSDRDAPDDVNHLHGYVSELRIWNRVRTAQEIRRDAFRRLSGSEEGLVGLWPFIHGLQDIAGGHDAGLMGNASLAREGRDVTRFPPTPTPPPYTAPTPTPIPAWDRRVPATAGAITLDGICRPAEYPDESTLTLEPDRYTSMHLLAARDALYLCTNVIMGGHGLPSAVTLWINRDGRGSAAPGPADLRLRLLPDGTLTAGAGDGRDYNAPAPFAFASQVISDTRFALQEDIRTVDSPWWAGEIRIPWEALTPYAPGDPLRFALKYEGTVAAGALPDRPQQTTLTGGWPAAFDPRRPDSWGVATTEKPPHPIYLPLVGRQVAQDASLRSSIGETAQTGDLITIAPNKAQANRPAAPSGWPRSAPIAAEFEDSCPNWIGNQWIKPVYAFDKDKKWPLVDENFPVVQADGKLTSMRVSPEDSSFIHDSHDLDMHMSLRLEDRWLSLSGGSDLVLETESNYITYRSFPMEQGHVTVKGRWIFDCGHDPKTEIHPIPVFETDRLVRVPDGIGPTQHLETVRVAHIWMTDNPHPFKYNLDNLGPFTFNLDYPPPSESSPPSLSNWGNDLLYLRVAEGSAGYVSVTGFTPNGIQVTINPPASWGEYYFELVLGYLDPVNPVPATGELHHVRLDAIEILDDLDSGWPDCWGVHDCGEWSMLIAINGSWKRIWEDKLVYDGDPPYQLSGFNIPVVGNDDLHLRVIGYENDDPFEGDEITQDGWTIPGTCCGQRTFQPGGDWKLYYTVYDGYEGGLTALPTFYSQYWGARLADEPNDDSIYGYNLGTLTVTDDGLKHIRLHDSYLTQQPLVKSDVRLLSNDVDRYRFALEDFADVVFGTLPPGVHVAVDQTYPWEFAGSLPPDLAALIGYTSARIHVQGDSPEVTDQPYSLQIETRWRTLPLDWGEDQEQGRLMIHGGRLVELVKPDPATTITPEVYLKHPASRYLQRDWAWQHVVGDIDYYDVWIPPVKTRPPGQPTCEFDREGELRVSAYGMHLRAGTSHLAGDAVAEGAHSIKLHDLNAQFPDGHVYVRVESLTGHRGFYRFSADWNDAQYFTPDECSLLHTIRGGWLKAMGHPAINMQSIYVPQLDLPKPPPFSSQLALYDLGGYQPLSLERAGILNTIISSAAEQPIVARLVDMNGVLLAEGTPLDADSNGSRVLDGQLPRSRLTVRGLEAGEDYFVQIVPAFDVDPSGAQDATVGFTQQGTGD